MTEKSSKIAIYGVNHLALLLGRACALSDNPVTGVWDQDSSKALQAALFLGVSAMTDGQQLVATGPGVLVCAIPCPPALMNERSVNLILNLHDKSAGEALSSKQCWLRSQEHSGPEIPLEITSELPALRVQLDGNANALAEARAFLGKIWKELEFC